MTDDDAPPAASDAHVNFDLPADLAVARTVDVDNAHRCGSIASF
jgi:hypothetical protein